MKPAVPALLCSLLLLLPPAHAGTHGRPFLRPAFDMHTNVIMDIQCDDDSATALTCSLDKTACVWQLPAGRLLHVLRPPIGEGSIGELYACALDHGGYHAAVGGRCVTTSGQPVVYIFDVSDARLSHTLPVVGRTQALRFSPSGRALAVLTGTFLHIWVREEGEWKETARHPLEGGQSLDWHGEARIAIGIEGDKEASLALFIRRPNTYTWDSFQERAPGGVEIRQVVFSPDGRRIAVGFLDTPNVTVHDATSLMPLYAPDVSDIQRGCLSAVTWANDGALVAAGSFQDPKTKRMLLRVWEDLGRGPPRDFPASGKPIYALATGPHKRAFFAAADPSFGVLGGDSNVYFLGRSPLASFKETMAKIRPDKGAPPVYPAPLSLSGDARLVTFPYTDFSFLAAQFDLVRRTLTTNSLKLGQDAPRMHPPKRDGVRLTHDAAGHHINGRLAESLPPALPVAAAIASADGGTIICASQRGLHAVRSDGTEKWSAFKSASSFSLNQSADEKVLVAAGIDGILSWHSAATGDTLLNLMVDAMAGEWVLWTEIPHTTTTRRAFFGITPVNLQEGVVLIDAVAKDSPAAKAGLKANDRLIKIDNVLITHQDMPPEILRDHHSGDRITVHIQRLSGEEPRPMTFEVELGEWDKKEVTGSSIFYDCSPGADRLLGLHFNRAGGLTPDFFPIEAFKNICYQPKVISHIIETWELFAALKLAPSQIAPPAAGQDNAPPHKVNPFLEALLPPQVEEVCHKYPAVIKGNQYTVYSSTPSVIDTSLSPSESRLTLSYSVRQTGSTPPAYVDIRFNGHRVPIFPTETSTSPLPHAPVPKPGEKAEVTIQLPDGVAGTISIYAGHEFATGNARVFELRRPEPEKPASLPRLFVLSVGANDLKINDPADGKAGSKPDGIVTSTEIDRHNAFAAGNARIPPGLTDLDKAAFDAERVAGHQSFTQQEPWLIEKGRTYSEVSICPLTGPGATSAAVRDELRKIAAAARPADTVVFFFSGHGAIFSEAGYHLATHDTDPADPSRTSLSGTELGSLLSDIQARRLIILDACNSGALTAGPKAFTPDGRPRPLGSVADLNALVSNLTGTVNGCALIMSSGPEESSIQDPEDGGLIATAITHFFDDAISFRMLIQGTEPSLATASDQYHQDLANNRPSSFSAPGPSPWSCQSLQDFIRYRVPTLYRAAFQKSAPKAKSVEQLRQLEKRQTPICILPPGVPDFVIGIR